MAQVPKVYSEKTPPVSTEELESRLSTRLNGINDYFSPDKFQEVLATCKPKEVAVMEAIYLDKLMALRQPSTPTITPAQQHNADKVFTALMDEMKRRGLQATLTERKAVISAT